MLRNSCSLIGWPFVGGAKRALAFTPPPTLSWKMSGEPAFPPLLRDFWNLFNLQLLILKIRTLFTVCSRCNSTERQVVIQNHWKYSQSRRMQAVFNCYFPSGIAANQNVGLWKTHEVSKARLVCKLENESRLSGTFHGMPWLKSIT